MDASKIGLVLSGGGARGAYQAGLLKAIAELSAQNSKSPIKIITGVSAGAINAAYLASSCHDWVEGCEKLANMWCNLTSEQVFRTDAVSLGGIGLKWLSDTTLGSFYKKKLARALLETKPLRKLLHTAIPFERIQQNLDNGSLEALAVTAVNYGTATSTTFVQDHGQVDMWSRSRRHSERSPITVDHIMASSAIPLFFPPIKVGSSHFGDGCLRNTAPLSPAIHLGADKIIVISVRRPDAIVTETMHYDPTLARVLGVIMNALLLDAVDMDMERMSRINKTIESVPETLRSDLSLRKVDFLWLRPSQDIGKLAGGQFHRLPSMLRYLMGGLGSSHEASELTSYLLFDPDYCGKLVELGYQDGLAQAKEIRDFLA